MKILDIIYETTPTAKVQLSATDIEALAKAWITANPQKAAGYSATATKGYSGGVLKIFKTVGLITYIAELNLNLYALNEIAKEPLETFRSSNPKFSSYTQEEKDAYIKTARDQYYGIWSTQILVPLLAKWIRGGMPVVKQFFDLLENEFGAVGGAKGRVLFKIIGTVGMTALMAWLGTPGGTEWLANSIFMPLIRTVGSGVAWSWDKIWPTIQDVSGMPLDKINPDTQQSVDNVRQSSPDTGPSQSYADFQKSKAALYKPGTYGVDPGIGSN